MRAACGSAIADDRCAEKRAEIVAETTSFNGWAAPAAGVQMSVTNRNLARNPSSDLHREIRSRVQLNAAVPASAVNIAPEQDGLMGSDDKDGAEAEVDTKGKIVARAYGGGRAQAAGNDAHFSGHTDAAVAQAAGNNVSFIEKESTRKLMQSQQFESAMREMRTLIEESLSQFLRMAAESRDATRHEAKMVEDMWLEHASKSLRSRTFDILEPLAKLVPEAVATVVKQLLK